jgi:hypothetical protein
MSLVRKALDARWFLIVITIGLWVVTGIVHSERSKLETSVSSAELQRRLVVQARVRAVLPGEVGESVANQLRASDRMEVAFVRLVSSTTEVLTSMAFLGLVGSIINTLPWMRRRSVAAVQPGVEPPGPTARGLTP